MKPIVPTVFPWKDHSKYTYPLGLDVAGVCFLSGNSASEFDAATQKIVVRGDLEAQIATALAKIRSVLEAGGLSFADVISTIQYVTPAIFAQVDRLPAMLQAHGLKSAVTHVVPVNRLMRRDALIEIEVIAARAGHAVVNGTGTSIKIGTNDVFTLVAEAPPSDGSIEAEVRRNDALLASLGMNWSHVIRSRLFTAASESAVLDARTAAAASRIDGLPVLPAIGMTKTNFDGSKLVVELCAPNAGREPARAAHGGLIRDCGSFFFATGLQCDDDSLGLVAQLESIYSDIVPSLLAEAGMEVRHIVQTVEWLTEETLPAYRETAGSRRRLLREPFPVASGLVCSVLPNNRKIVVDLVASPL